MHSIETMAELVLKGTEIHPALSAPEDVKIAVEVSVPETVNF